MHVRRYENVLYKRKFQPYWQIHMESIHVSATLQYWDSTPDFVRCKKREKFYIIILIFY